MSGMVPDHVFDQFVRWLDDESGLAAWEVWPGVGVYTGIRPHGTSCALGWGLIGKRGAFEREWLYTDETLAVGQLLAWDPTRGGEPEGAVWTRTR